ncbi:unnamed protein product [Spodoptera littoralis]|uniref:Strictosidine synthase conserved region domain-containing protein n=1 Tax=Spodoptera littoralis TaxID=7109 RepID=A0A9P0I090_SPOLI|nr:unnamed protein product [Spodoptera littoralis]CAH1637793.1 unnamed protein product [Spodoptera littoralis]
MGFIFNFIKRLFTITIKTVFFLVLISAIIVLIPNFPPYTKFTSIEIQSPQPRVGPLATNGALNNCGKLYPGKLLGPEAFQIYKGEVYTSLATGEIVKLSPQGHVTFVTKIGEPCSGLVNEHICGRPLGFVIDDKDGNLYVADAYYGIWKVNLNTNKKQLLVSSRVAIQDRLPKLFNSVALAKNGDLYWTDSTSDFGLKDGVISSICDPSGRLFHYDAVRNQSKVLLDDLWFANGVVVSPNEDFVLVCETFRSRLMKYYLRGPKKGQSEVFVDGLPGAPDNARPLPDGSGILVALYTVFEEDRPPLTKLMAAAPLVRKLAARLHRLVEIPLEYLNSLSPNIIFEEIIYSIGHFKTLSGIAPQMAGLVQLDWDGNIVATYYNTDKSLGPISDAIVFNGKLYTGSPHTQDYVGAVDAPPQLKKAFESFKQTETPKVETKPVQQPPVKKTEEKPKAAPKPQQEAKPTTPPPPKPTEKTTPPPPPKPVEKTTPPPPKPVEKTAPPPPKPVEKTAPPPPKPVEKTTPPPPKPAEKTPPPPPKPAEKTPPRPPKPAEKTPPPPPKPVEKVSPPPPKPAEKATPPPPKPAEKATPPPTKVADKSTPPPPPKPAAKASPPPPKAAEKPSPPPPKPAEKTTPPPPKAAEKPSSPPPKAAEPKKEEPKVQTAETKPKPIKEEIPSDTIKPTKETLKVIKKDGPAEIHVPVQ